LARFLESDGVVDGVVFWFCVRGIDREKTRKKQYKQDKQDKQDKEIHELIETGLIAFVPACLFSSFGKKWKEKRKRK